jgi:hypothetical protein
MANRLSVRHRGGMGYEVGPVNHGKGLTARVTARNRKEALMKGKAELRERGIFSESCRQSYRREANGIDTREGTRVPKGNRSGA